MKLDEGIRGDIQRQAVGEKLFLASEWVPSLYLTATIAIKIGDDMNHGPSINFKARILIGLACIAIGLTCWPGNDSCQAQTPANLDDRLKQVIKLSQAQMTDDVIVNYIKGSGASYNLSVDDILYLKSQGVSPAVIAALQQTKTAVPANPNPASVAPPQSAPPSNPPPPAPQAEAPGPPAQEASLGYFHDQLTPFGAWVEIGGVQYWRPDSALRANPDWRPYYDMGRWVQTDNGLFWQSDYQWGDIPFHYGRWVLYPGMGWLWAPDLVWGPSWVFWRHAEADAAIGWAPLPVGAVFVDDAFMFNGVRVGVDFEFGLGEGCFTFVDYDHFHEGFFRMRGREYAYHIHGERFHEFYHRSVVRNEFRRDEHGRFVNNGIGRERMESATHGRLEHSSFEERHPVGDRNQLAAKRAEAGKPGEHPAAGGADKPVQASAAAKAAPSKVFRPPAPAQKPAVPAKTKK